MANRSAVIAGATGLVGGHILEVLLNDPLYDRVTVLTRRPLDTTHPKLALVRTDFEDLDAHAKSIECDDVYCALGTTIRAAGSREAFARVDHDYVVNVAEHTHAAGAKRFMLVSSVGASATSWTFYLRVKGETERDVKALGFDQLEIAQPGLLLGERKEHRIGEKLSTPVMKAASAVMVGPMQAYKAIHARDVARGLVGAARSEVEGVRVHTFESLMRLSKMLEA